MPKSSQKPSLPDLIHLIRTTANPEKGQFLQKFFKTGPGQYAEGDIFLGITVPTQRQIAKQFSQLSLPDLTTLIQSKYHEDRLIALMILCFQFERAQREDNLMLQTELYNFYLSSTTYINNWDLVDASARPIVGTYLLDKPRKILYQLAKSANLWERRIAIIATFAFLKQRDFTDTLKISKQLFGDKHDLIHKAVGWMLREVGKVDRPTLDQFLRTHYQQMPRTALRYAIEHYPEEIRQQFLKNKI